MRRRIWSLIIPPSVSPITPAKKTAKAKMAVLARSSFCPSLKKDGSQFRYSQSVHA